MNERSDQQLLARYAQTRDEAAFGELVRRQVDLVYSAARRLVVDAHLAEDVTQAVFVALARQAAPVSRRLAQGAPLSGWLHLTTRNVAAKLVRTEVRRRDREQEALAMQTAAADTDEAVWTRIAPHLDHALAELPEPDREALLWRFFERQTAREIGARLGTSEDAAQKRVSRALEKLRTVFVARGLAVPAASLTSVLTVNAVQTAPVSLAGTITAAALAGPGGLLAQVGLLQLMNSAKLKLGAAALVAAGVTTTIAWQHRQGRQLQAEVVALRAQAAAQAAVQPVTNTASVDSSQLEDLLRLRGEVAQLRRQQQELERLRAENQRLKTATAARDQSGPTEDPQLEAFKQRGIAKMLVAQHWVLACFLYAEANNGVFPTSFDQARKYYSEQTELPAGVEAPSEQDFEILFSGSLTQIANPASAIVLRERDPFANFGRPGYSRTYAFADGHSEIKHTEDGNFEAWERQRQPVLKPPAGGAGNGAQ